MAWSFNSYDRDLQGDGRGIGRMWKLTVFLANLCMIQAIPEHVEKLPVPTRELLSISLLV